MRCRRECAHSPRPDLRSISAAVRLPSDGGALIVQYNVAGRSGGLFRAHRSASSRGVYGASCSSPICPAPAVARRRRLDYSPISLCLSAHIFPIHPHHLQRSVTAEDLLSRFPNPTFTGCLPNRSQRRFEEGAGSGINSPISGSEICDVRESHDRVNRFRGACCTSPVARARISSCLRAGSASCRRGSGRLSHVRDLLSAHKAH